MQKPEYSASRPPPAAPRTGGIARPASFWDPARRELRVIDAPDAARQPKSPFERSREPKKTLPARMQPPRLAENSRKCTARPRGPVRAVKKHARIQKNAGVKARWRQGRQAAGEIPGVPARVLRPPRVSRKPHVLRRCRIAHPPYQPFAQNGNAPSAQTREQGIDQVLRSAVLLCQRPSVFS